MNLHVLYNGGDGTYDVVNIKDDGTLEYVSDGFSTGEGAHGFIEGWHAAGEYAGPEQDHLTDEAIEGLENLRARYPQHFQYRD